VADVSPLPSFPRSGSERISDNNNNRKLVTTMLISGERRNLDPACSSPSLELGRV